MIDGLENPKSYVITRIWHKNFGPKVWSSRGSSRTWREPGKYEKLGSQKTLIHIRDHAKAVIQDRVRRDIKRNLKRDLK